MRRIKTIPENIVITLIRRARKKHGEIFPVNKRRSLRQCFTDGTTDHEILFWYNDRTDSTHIEKHIIGEKI